MVAGISYQFQSHNMSEFIAFVNRYLCTIITIMWLRTYLLLQRYHVRMH